MEKPSLFMSLYSHRHGTSVGMLIAKDQTEAEAEFHKWWLEDGLEEDREDESVEVFPAIIRDHKDYEIVLKERS